MHPELIKDPPPLYCLPPPPSPFSNFVQPPLHTFLSPPTSTPTVLSVFLFLWLNGWSRHIWCAILCNDNMDLHMSSLVTLAPEGTWYVFYATRHQVYGGLKYNVVFTGTLIWYHRHISTDIILRGQWTDTPI